MSQPRSRSSAHGFNRAAATGRPWRAPAPLALLVLFALGISPSLLRSQEAGHHKVPVLDKITSGPNEQAFSGRVASVDLKRHILNVNAVEGQDVEIFPIASKVKVIGADGGKMKVAALAPGTNVIVYYEQKGDRRTVKNIVVLTAPRAPEKKAEAAGPPT